MPPSPRPVRERLCRASRCWGADAGKTAVSAGSAASGSAAANRTEGHDGRRRAASDASGRGETGPVPSFGGPPQGFAPPPQNFAPPATENFAPPPQNFSRRWRREFSPRRAAPACAPLRLDKVMARGKRPPPRSPSRLRTSAASASSRRRPGGESARGHNGRRWRVVQSVRRRAGARPSSWVRASRCTAGRPWWICTPRRGSSCLRSGRRRLCI